MAEGEERRSCAAGRANRAPTILPAVGIIVCVVERETEQMGVCVDSGGAASKSVLSRSQQRIILVRPVNFGVHARDQTSGASISEYSNPFTTPSCSFLTILSQIRSRGPNHTTRWSLKHQYIVHATSCDLVRLISQDRSSTDMNHMIDKNDKTTLSPESLLGTVQEIAFDISGLCCAAI